MVVGRQRVVWSSRTASRPGAIAQRIVLVAAVPSAFTTVRSVTGVDGSRSGRRVQRGISPIPAAISTPYAVRRTERDRERRAPQQVADRVAGVVGDPQLGPERLEHRPQLGLGLRRVDDPETAGDLTGLGDVLVALRLVERVLAVGLVGK